MTEGINVGDVYATVLPDARQFNTKLAEIARNAAVMVKVDADTTAAKARIDELAGGDVKVGVDVDDADATAKLDELTRNREVNVQVDADTGDAQAKIDALNQGASNAGGGLGFLKTAAIALSPALIPVASAALGVTSALAVMGAAGIAGAGVMTVAFGGVTGAVKLLGQQQAQESAAANAAGQSAAAHAQAVVAAQRQIESAQMSLADVQRSAADQQIQDSQSVQSAQYALAQADQQETAAVNALVTAREAAARQLESYANQAVDAALAQKQSVLDLQTAQANYAKTNANASATDQQRQQAALDLQKAQQRVVEAQQAATNATQDNTKAQKAGVDGAPQVVSATQAVASAQHNQQQAAQGLADAQRKAAEDQVKSQESIVRAQQGVAAAMDAMAAAQRNSAGSASAALAATNAQIAKLDPATRNFAEYLRGTWSPIWEKIQGAAAKGFLPGVQSGMESLRPLMPQFIGFIGDLSQRLGDLAAQAGKALAGPFWQQFFGFMERTGGPALTALGHILGNLIEGFAGLLMAFEPIITPMISGIETLSQKFADFGKQASTSSGFGRFIKYVQDSLPLVGNIVGNILRAVGEAVVGLAPLGTAILKLLQPLAKFLANDVIPFLTPIVRFIADQVAPVFGKILGAAIDGARVAFAWIMQVVKDNRPELEQLWSFISTKLAPVIGFILKVAFEVVGVAIGAVIKIVSILIDMWNAMWQVGKDLAAWFSGPFVDFFVGVWNHIRDGWRNLVNDIRGLWQDIEHWVMDPVAWVVRFVINDGLIKAWDWISDHLLFGALHANPMDVPAVPPLAAANGGVIPGYAPGVDSVHVMASPGEGILVPEAVRGLGGAPAIRALNSQFSGRAPGGGNHFAGGGVVGSIIASLVPGAGLAALIGGQKMTAIIDDPVGAMQDMVKTIMGGIGKAGPFIDMLGQVVLGMAKGAGGALLQAIEGSSFAGLTGLSDRAAAGLPNIPTISPGALSGLANLGRLGTVSLGQQMAAAVGWTGSEWNSLLALWNRESGWNANAVNPSSGAYGIPQALGHGHPYDLGDAAAQIAWGINYIAGRYGDPNAAWAHEVSAGWYDQGGLVPPGPSLVYNGTGQPELIAPAQTFKQIISGASGGEMPRRSGPSVFNIVDQDGTLLGSLRGMAEKRGGTRRAFAAAGVPL